MDLFDEFINIAESKLKTKETWREKPVGLIEFFKSKDFLNEKPYLGKQTEVLETVDQIIQYKLLGKEDIFPEKLKHVTELALLLGKGSGKDFLASGILAYMCYVICCLNDPHEFFGFGQDEPIDLINVAINAYQANNVFFKKLKARLANCKWFKRVNYNPSETDEANYNEFQITKNQIRFYKNITAHSAHSEADSFEGFNPLVVIFDEIGGYEYQNAEDAYSTLRSSAISRYNKRA